MKPISKAPAGTGQLIRDASREGNDNKLASLLSKWKGDPVINEVTMKMISTNYMYLNKIKHFVL